MDLMYGLCTAATLFPMVCGTGSMQFKQVYDVACYHHVEGARGGWAGAGGEETVSVMRRVADGSALYQDYLREYDRTCGRKQ